MLKLTKTPIHHLLQSPTSPISPIVHIGQSFSSIQTHKQTQIQKKAQRQGIMKQKQLQHNYKLINSSPNDSIQEIHHNFIQVKEIVNKRHFYIPDKKEYLMKLDQAYDQVLQVHDDYNILDMAKPRGPMTKNELVAYELQKIQRSQKYELYQTYEFVGLLLTFLFLIQIMVEQYENKSIKRMPISQHFELSKALANFKAKTSDTFGQLVVGLGGDKERKDMVRKLRDMGIVVKEEDVGKKKEVV